MTATDARARLHAMFNLPDTDEAELNTRIDTVIAEATAGLRARVAKLEGTPVGEAQQPVSTVTEEHACDNCDGIDPDSCLNNPGRAAAGRTPCSVPVACEPGGEPCERHEREESHAEGEHELCGAECPAAGLDASQPATDPLVHVGWWCWRGDNHGHLATTACRSDNVPLHVPTEWADEMRAVIQHLTDDHEPGEDCTWLSPEDQAAETLAAADTEGTDQ